MDFAFRAYMNHRDVTGWIDGIDLEHPRNTLYRTWTFRFKAWSSIEDGARWDLFASYEPETNPRAENLSRDGILPPDRERHRLALAVGSLPRLEVKGYDFVWSAQRTAPRETIVLVPSTGYIVEEGPEGQPVLRTNSVSAALEKYEGPVGRYRVWTNVSTIHSAIGRLAAAAGLRAQCLFPNRPIVPKVIPPTDSLWSAIRDLAAPWKPRFYYSDATNTLKIEDSLSAHYPTAAPLKVPKNVVKRISGRPVYRDRTRRVIVKVN